MMMQGLLRAGALAVVVALSAACGDGGGGGGAAKGGQAASDVKTFGGGPAGGTLIVLSDREPDDLNPLTYDTNPSYQLIHLMFRALGRRDSTLTGYTPDLLERWEQPDSATVVLHIRPGLKWHDGQAVSAEDVVFTIERQKDPKLGSPRLSDVDAVESVRARDSMTVEVKLSRTGTAALNALLEVVPVPRHLLANVAPDQMKFSPFGQRPVGSGLFRFGRWDRNQQVVLEANPAAPDGRPALDRIIVRNIPDASARLTALLNGEGDLLPKVPADQSARVEAGANVRLMHAARVRPAWITWNVDKEPVSDPRVRRALLMGIDRATAVRAVLGEGGEPALTPVPPRLRQHSQQIRPIPYDPAGAGRLLDEAGWRDANGDGVRERGGRPLRVEVEYSNSDPVRQDMLIRIQADLKKIGVDLVPRPYESTTWVERLRGREFVGSFWGWGWGPGVLAPNAQAVFHSKSIPPHGPNFAGYRNPRVDALIDSLLVESDRARAAPMWAAFEQQITDDAVYAPIFLDPEFYGVNERFANVHLRGPEWWEDVIYWSVPLDRRTARDRMQAR
jgi:peptide/nickel transport system substrate-binding protein